VVDAERVELVEDLQAAPPTFAFEPVEYSAEANVMLDFSSPPSLGHLCLVLRFLRFKLSDLAAKLALEEYVGDDDRDPKTYQDDALMLAESTLWLLTAHVEARDRWEEVYGLKLTLDELQSRQYMQAAKVRPRLV